MPMKRSTVTLFTSGPLVTGQSVQPLHQLYPLAYNHHQKDLGHKSDLYTSKVVVTQLSWCQRLLSHSCHTHYHINHTHHAHCPTSKKDCLDIIMKRLFSSTKNLQVRECLFKPFCKSLCPIIFILVHELWTHKRVPSFSPPLCTRISECTRDEGKQGMGVLMH